MSDRFPRVLIVSSDSISSPTGTGITLRNLFGDWPSDALLQVRLNELDAPSQGADHRYPPSSFPVDNVIRPLLGKVRPQAKSAAPAIAAVPLPSNPSRTALVHATIRSALDLSPIVYSRAIAKTAREFAPDVIYSILGSSRIIRIATHLSKSLDLPLVPHFMDDWPSTLYSSGELGGLARRLVMRQLHQALRRSPVALCISDLMAEEYERQFGLPCESFVNPSLANDHLGSLGEVSDPIEFVYVGGLHLGRWDMLLSLAEGLSKVTPQCVLVIHAPNGEAFSDKIPPHLAGSLRIAASLDQDQVPERLASSDVLVHVESLDPSNVKYTRLSLSTKVPQYLMAGRPILAMGPMDQASMQVIAASGAGELIYEDQPEAIASGCRRLLARTSEFGAMGEAGHAYAATRFELHSVRERFRTSLTTAAGQA